MNRLDAPSTNRLDAPEQSQSAIPAKQVTDYLTSFFPPVGISGFTKTNYEIGSFVLNFLKDVGQSIVRSFVATGLTVAEINKTYSTKNLIGIPDIISTAIPDGTDLSSVKIPNWLQWATGRDKVEDLGTQALKLEQTIKNSPFAQKYGFDKFALPLAIGGIAINTGLDVSVFGGEENLVKALVKEQTPEGVAKILQKIGIKDADLIKTFAKQIAETTDEQGVKDALNILKGANGIKTGTLLTNEAVDKIPNTVDEFGALPYDVQEKIFPSLSKTLQDQIMGNPIKEAVGNQSVLDEYANKILSGELKVRTGVDSKTEAQAALGPGRYMRIFSTDPNATPLDEIVQLINDKAGSDITVSDLIEKLATTADKRLTLGREAIAQAGKSAIPDTTTHLTEGAKTLLNLPEGEKASVSSIIDNAAGSVKNKVHILDYFQTPEFVLKKLGLEGESQLLHDAYDAYRKEVKDQIAKIIDWKKAVDGIPDASKQIFRYLDGQSVELSEKELKVANEMKDYLKVWADRLGLPEDKRIAQYITHIFEPDFIKKEFDPELARLISDKIAGSVYDPFLEKRLGALGYKEDVFAALDAYVKRATRKVNMDPALEALKKASERLDVESVKYIQRLSARINLRPTEVDNLLDNLFKNVFGYRFGVRPVTRISNTIRQWVYRGTLGLNLGSALRNLTQGVNTYAKLGEKYTIVGYSQLLSRLATRNLDELFERGILDDALVQDRRIGVYKSILQKLDSSLYMFFDLAEKINRGAAYFGAKAKAIAAGAGEEEAANIAKKLVRETQFAFGNIDSPVIMSSDLAKLGFQLQTYNIKQLEFLKNMIKNKELGGLLRWAGASVAAVYTVGQLFGMKMSNIIPTVNLGGSPFGNFITGLGDLLSPSAQTRAQAQSKMGANVASFFPAGAQIRKSIQGAEVVARGEDVTPAGNTRYKVAQTPENLIRAVLFGKASLPEAQQYYKDLNAPKKPKKKKIYSL